jgi:hypothetical protein
MDIWDTRSATVGYTNGMMLRYALHNYSPCEGFRLILNGTGGRIELDVMEHSYISGADGKLSVQQGVSGVEIRLQKLFEARRIIMDWDNTKDWFLGVDERRLIRALDFIHGAISRLNMWPRVRPDGTRY